LSSAAKVSVAVAARNDKARNVVINFFIFGVS
jgi:hypothetical protein